jgi:ketosteroid isomerase-like protein
MKNFAVITFALLFLSLDAFGQKTIVVKAPAKPATVVVSASSVTDEKAVRAAFDTLLEGIRTSNVDGVTGVYWNSPETLFYNNNGSVTTGWEQDRKNREARYPRTSNVKIDVKNVRVMMLGAGGAVVACQWTQTQAFDANPESASGRMTLVFRKIGKDWKIVHLHTSPDNPPATRPILSSEKNENTLDTPVKIIPNKPKK